MLVDLRLIIDTGRDRNSNMTDWVKKAAQDARERSARAREEGEHARLDAEAVRIQAPRIWDDLQKELQARVQEFNAEFADSLLGTPVSFGLQNSRRVMISTAYKQPNGSYVSISILFEPDKQAVEFKVNDSENRLKSTRPPNSLYFKAFNNGSVSLVGGDRVFTAPAIAEMVSKLVFGCVELMSP